MPRHRQVVAVFPDGSWVFGKTAVPYNSINFTATGPISMFGILPERYAKGWAQCVGAKKMACMQMT